MPSAQETREEQTRITKEIEDYLDYIIQDEIARGSNSAWDNQGHVIVSVNRGDNND